MAAWSDLVTVTRRLLEPAVVGDDRLVAEHDAVLDERAAADVAVAAEDRARARPLPG